MRRALLGLLALLVAAAFLVPGLVVVPHGRPDAPCAQRSAELVVHGPSKRMWLCEAGQPVEEFRVGIGRAGLGKRSQGDNRTPVGEYALGAPHASTRFHVFVPVGYPTAEQRRAGYSGADVGIHGPVTWMRWLPGGGTWFNRTRGCIEVGSVADIERVASWVRQGRVQRIHLE